MNISVVIPTHKRSELLRRSIDSVFSQTYPAYEIIVVDDAGCDATRLLVENYNIPMIRYFENNNGTGAASSRNLGAEVATGDYIAFLDDDDVWLSSKLEKQCRLIMEGNLDVCFSRLSVQYENSSICYSTSVCNVPNPSFEILMENYIGATISAVIRRSLFVTVGGFDLSFKAREEYDLWIRLIHTGASIGVVEEPLAISYRSLENRARVSLSVDNYISAISLLNAKHKILVDKFLSSPQKIERVKRQYNFIAAQAVSIGLRKEAILYYFKSLAAKPSMKALLAMLVCSLSPRLLIKLREKIG